MTLKRSIVERDAPGLLARLMSLYIVVAVGRLGDLVPWLHEIPLAKLVAGVAIIAALRSRTATGANWKSAPPAKWTLALMGVVIISILWSFLRSASFGIITGTALAVIVTMLLVIKAARNWVAVKTILFGTVLASIVLVATVFTSKVIDAGGYRAGYSNSYDPNDFAFVLIGLLPLVVTFGIISRRTKRLCYFGVACAVVVSILLTQSRGGFIGLLVDVVAMTFFLPLARRGQLQFRASTRGIIARAILLALVGLIIWQSLPDSARARLGTITELGSDYNANVTEGGRLAIWSRNLPLIANRPWGFGAGSFEAVDGLLAGGQYRAPHNTLLEVLIELGVPGLVLFIAIIVSSLRYLRAPQHSERDTAVGAEQDEARAFARGLAVGWVGLCLTGFFLSQLYSNVLWTFVTLSCAVGIIRRGTPASVRTTSTQTAPRAPQMS